jgi:copper chaperone CopZ
MRRVTLSVQGMSCAHCQERVRSALAALPGVEVLEVSVGEGRVDVSVAEDGPADAGLKAAVEKAGYRVLH